MKFLLSFLFTGFISAVLNGQTYTLESPLDNAVSETSGLLFINNTLITHNDSANSNQLFEIDLTTGNVSRVVTVINASNADWEDLTHDETYIYIGDFGNFDATRTNLRVYRIAKSDYFSSTDVTADVINFSYSEQTDFSVQEFSTNFDAEALVHIDNSLFIFTKNWADGNTNIYELPKTPGTYSLSIIDVVNSQGLVTGATKSMDGSKIVLCGYDGLGPFVIELSNFSAGLFSNGTVIKTNIAPPTGYSFQTEGITPISTSDYFVSAEAANGDPQGLYSINLSTLSNEKVDYGLVKVFPNPAKNIVEISSDNYFSKIYSLTGQLVKSYDSRVLDISEISNGFYVMKLIEKTNPSNILSQQLIIAR